ncbi:hypothetical protein ASE07_11710 [Noviherbaspirillum sp. Root189]|nr:hypothetical protein ASE07_11710 [Noviherbaspirillum sp. Root189]
MVSENEDHSIVRLLRLLKYWHLAAARRAPFLAFARSAFVNDLKENAPCGCGKLIKKNAARTVIKALTFTSLEAG